MLLQPYLCIIVHDESVPAGVDVNVSLVILSDVLKKTSQAESHLPTMTLQNINAIFTASQMRNKLVCALWWTICPPLYHEGLCVNQT